MTLVYFLLCCAALYASSMAGLRSYDLLRRYYGCYGTPIDLAQGILLALFAGAVLYGGIGAFGLMLGIS